MRHMPARQRGAALMLFITVLILGIAWYAVGALGTAPVARAEREVQTGVALQAAKRALLAYAAQYAARTDHDHPGRLPCPESLNLTNPGEASPSCSNTAATVGRLPWKTLGINELRDGDGELLWYVLSPNFRGPTFPATAVPNPLPSPPPSPRPNWELNFSTPGSIAFDGAEYGAVALIIAPGRGLNTQPLPGTPSAGCAKVNQLSGDRYAAPLNPANYFECGNASGSYAGIGTSEWSNDRVIAISTSEWADAIAGPVADRLQRTVAPVLAAWDQTELAVRGKSWAATPPNGHSRPYLPFASAFTDPATNDYCGDAGASPSEGLPPLAAAASGGCNTNWTGSASLVLGVLSNLGCTQTGTQLVCAFQRVLGTAPFSVRVTATAQNVANSFRGTILTSDVTVTGGGSHTFTLSSFSSATGAATVIVDASWPFALGFLQIVEVRIPNLPDAVFMTDTTHASYDATRWFRENAWTRYAYYAAAPGATLNPSSACAAPGDPGCLTLTGLPASTGNTNDKRLVLALMGPRALGSQSPWPNGSPANYLESHAAGTTTYGAQTVSSIFNDRLAACPFQHTPASGTPVAICN